MVSYGQGTTRHHIAGYIHSVAWQDFMWLHTWGGGIGHVAGLHVAAHLGDDSDIHLFNTITSQGTA